MIWLLASSRLRLQKVHRIYCQAYSTTRDESLSSSIRALMRSSAQPVAVITSLLPPIQANPIMPAYVHGATLSSFSTISLDPPLLAFSLQTPSRMGDSLQFKRGDKNGAHFVINILSEAQKEEATGFSKPGLAPFSLGSDWTTTFDINDHDNDIDHPLSQSPFHASDFAMDTEGVSVPVLTNSLGSLACSIVYVLPLKSFDVDQTKAGHDDKSGSELFIAQIHGVESLRSKSTSPLVYWNQQFTSVKQ